MRLAGLCSGRGRNILLVCPETNEVDAVGQTLALARLWSRDYRVHVLLISSEQTLASNFRMYAVAVWLPSQNEDVAAYIDKALMEILEETTLAFAVTISVTTRVALLPLRRAGVSSLAIVSELASRSAPFNAVNETIAWADQVVMPSQMVLRDATASDWRLSPGRNVHVIPPGDCDLILEQPITQDDTASLQKLLRPEKAGRRRFIVLGAGPVSYTSGVDIFLEIARAVLAQNEGRDALFVWVGSGFEPHTGGYSAELLAQLRTAELESRVIFLPDTPAIAALYESADLFVISARSEPVSHKAISALRSGLPVLCFEGTTNLAEHLKVVGLAQSCVARHLDVTEMADRIIMQASAPTRRAILAARSAAMAARHFHPQTQADTLARLAAEGSSNIKADADIICKSQSFDPEFCFGSESDTCDRRVAALKYLEGVRTGIEVRKPEPGFHPLVFAEMHRDVLQRDPYAEFLNLGRPPGPWCVPVISSKETETFDHTLHNSLRAALHIHAYYTEQLSDILARLRENAARPDLYISVTSEEGSRVAHKKLEEYSGAVKAIRIVPNLGRDIGPFLTAFGPQLVTSYDVVGHIHTKQSNHVLNHEWVRRWVELTLSGVIGGRKAGPVMDQVFKKFAADKKLGIVYPDDPHVVGWTANIIPARRIVASMNRGPLPDAFNFPVGTMFWMRSAAFKPFVDIGYTWDAFPAEPVATDGTTLHALERLFGVVPRLDGWGTAVTFTPGIGR